jgi:hypothetical protein
MGFRVVVAFGARKTEKKGLAMTTPVAIDELVLDQDQLSLLYSPLKLVHDPNRKHCMRTTGCRVPGCRICSPMSEGGSDELAELGRTGDSRGC